MSGDPRCEHCGAPEPAAGEMEHARTCPLATDEPAARFREWQKERQSWRSAKSTAASSTAPRGDGIEQR